MDQLVSIHAPRTGRDGDRVTFGRRCIPFQSTRPARGATVLLEGSTPVITGFNPRAPHGARRMQWLGFFSQHRVSIHAPRTGRDVLGVVVGITASSFNPRAPHGARQIGTKAVTAFIAFQSTRPARGATTGPYLRAYRQQVSIHAPRTGRDLWQAYPDA